MRHKSPEEREEMLNSLAALDGAESVFQTDGKAIKKRSKIRRYGPMVPTGILSGIVAGGGITYTVAIFVATGAIFVPAIGIPIAILVASVPLGFAMNNAARRYRVEQ